MIKLHNTLTKSLEEFKPLKSGEVYIYSCGPTVYDNVTIGNLRAYITSDTLNRVFELNKYAVKHVMNLTDIDDKTIARSRQDYPEDSAEIALKNLTQFYELLFMKDIGLIGNRVKKYSFIRASDSIKLMKDMIKNLIDDGFAYVADDGIYFSIEKYKQSGKTYGQLLDLDTSNTSKARINNDEYDKDYVHDFALWKFIKPNEPAWSFLFDGKDYLGRPGWHIECSAMSANMLGQPFDIHTGGVDLIFPHHENEIAQATAGKENPVFAKLFLHNEHVLVDNKKISKSLGNGITVADLTDKGFDPLAYRLFVLQSHYRNHSDFTWDLLTAAQARLFKLRNLSEIRWQASKNTPKHSKVNINSTAKAVRESIENDLNTPQALAEISKLQNQIEPNGITEDELDDFTELLELLDDLLGLELLSVPDLDDNQKDLLKKRAASRHNKDWSESDKIRDALSKVGVGVNDTEVGQIWYRLS